MARLGELIINLNSAVVHSETLDYKLGIKQFTHETIEICYYFLNL